MGQNQTPYSGLWSGSADVCIDGNQSQSVDSILGLGRWQSSDDCCRSDMKCHVGLTSSMMSSLRHNWIDVRLLLLTS